MKLTQQEAALYWGQDLKVAIPDGLNGVIKICGYAFPIINNQDATCQLLLRPLSDITEEEAKELSAWQSLSPSINEKAKSTTYLLSCGFDLFNWIEQGKALDKTKHKACTA